MKALANVFADVTEPCDLPEHVSQKMIALVEDMRGSRLPSEAIVILSDSLPPLTSKRERCRELIEDFRRQGIPISDVEDLVRAVEVAFEEGRIPMEDYLQLFSVPAKVLSKGGSA